MTAGAAISELRRERFIALASLLALLFAGADSAASSVQRSASATADDQLESSNPIEPCNSGNKPMPPGLPGTYPLQDNFTQPVECHDSQCSGHGTCLDGSCMCEKHYAGVDCTTFIAEDVHDECADPSCSGHGRCDVGLCRCEAGWTGGSCETQARCPQDCNSPSGRCIDGFCRCEDGYAGAACDQVVCLHSCYGHGDCNNGRCSCYDGWDGEECGEQMSLGYPSAVPAPAVPNAMFLEIASSESSTAVRQPFRTSGNDEMLDSVAPTFAPDQDVQGAVVPAPTAISFGQTPTSASAQKPAGTPEARASLAPVSTLASNAMRQVSAALGAADRAIEAAGALEAEGAKEAKQVKRRARQRAAQASVPGSQPRALPATAVTRRSTDPGYLPGNVFGGEHTVAKRQEAAAQSASTTTALPDVVAKLPELAPGACPDDCNGHGTCSDGVCSCVGDWAGELCEMEPCKDGCYGRGTCLNGACVCNAQFYGESCEFSRCLDDCSGHGYCEKGECTCSPGWKGAGCGIAYTVEPVKTGIRTRIEAEPAHLRSALQGIRGGAKSCAMNCSGQGRCDTETGSCSCYSGYTGNACENYCPNFCSKQGRCLQGACICLMGFAGVDCSIKICCSGHGDCTLPGQCVCNEGWVGDQCQVAKSCADPKCNSHGTCETGSCKCDSGWTGETCGEEPSECGGCPPEGSCDRETGTCMCGAGPCDASETKGGDRKSVV